jgi:RHS repeat-associated protein
MVSLQKKGKVKISHSTTGNVISDSNPTFYLPFGFAGGLHNRDTNFVRSGFRDYNLDIGKWTAKDPLLFKGGNIDLYGYVGNDPINFTDPKGLYVSGIGVAGGISGTVSPGLSGSGNFLYVWDDKGNRGILVSASGGIAGGAGIVDGLQVSNLWGYDTIFDLEGGSVNFAPGAGLGVGPGLAGEISSVGITTISGIGIGGWSGTMSVGGVSKLIWYKGNPPTIEQGCNKK